MDIVRVEVEKVYEDLVITITMSSPIDGWTFFDLYLLEDDTNTQPAVDTDIDSIEEFPDYMPANAFACNDITSGIGYWYLDKEISGNRCVLTGSLSVLQALGIDENFQIFIEVSTFDLKLGDPGEYLAYETLDYAGSGAWVVEGVNDGDMDDGGRGYSGDFIIYGTVPVIILLIAVSLVVYFAITKRGRSVIK
ncbi:MAG: hypothetical protein ACMUHB_06765 [Thermoplasmatota archaeon]